MGQLERPYKEKKGLQNTQCSLFYVLYAFEQAYCMMIGSVTQAQLGLKIKTFIISGHNRLMNSYISYIHPLATDTKIIPCSHDCGPDTSLVLLFCPKCT